MRLVPATRSRRKPLANFPKDIMADIPTPAQVALVRLRYPEDAPVRSIMAESGIKDLDILYRCLNGEFPDGSGQKLTPIPRRRAGARQRPRVVSRKALVARLWRAADRQVAEIEERLKAVGLEVSESESNARTLAIVAKTLREISAIDASARTRGKTVPTDKDDEAVPRNIDDLRQALARKLAAFAAGTEDPVPGKPE
jgi:hypothetical protein